MLFPRSPAILVFRSLCCRYCSEDRENGIKIRQGGLLQAYEENLFGMGGEIQFYVILSLSLSVVRVEVINNLVDLRRCKCKCEACTTISITISITQ